MTPVDAKTQYLQVQETYRLTVGLSYLVATVSTVAMYALTIYSMAYVPPFAAFIFSVAMMPVIFLGAYKTITILKATPDQMEPKTPGIAKVHIVWGLFLASMLFINVVGTAAFTSPGISAGLFASRVGLLAGFSALNLGYGVLSQKMHKLKEQGYGAQL